MRKGDTMNDKLDAMLLEAVEDFLHEAKANKSKVDWHCAYGTGGTFAKEIAFTKGRAEADPKGLLRDLGVTQKAEGKTDAIKAVSVLQQAIRSNEIMAEAYGDFKRTRTKNSKGQDVEGFSISFDEDLKQRDATKYLVITLRAAENGGILNLDKGIGFANAKLVSKPTIYAK